MKLVITVVLMGIVSHLFGQSLRIDDLALRSDGTITFSAEIEKSHSDREVYDLLIYSNIDGYTEPVAFSYGDMEPGKPYDISFNGNDVFGRYKGEVQLRFDAVASAFPIKLNNQNRPLKQGKPVNLSWEDFHDVNNYNVELYQGINLVEVLAEGHRSKSYDGVLSKDIEKGGNYTLLIKPIGDGTPSDPIPVSVKGAVGLIVKIAPLAAVGIAVPVFLLGGGGGTPPTGTTYDDPPGPPSGN